MFSISKIIYKYILYILYISVKKLMKGRFFFKEICLWLSNLDVVREHQMLFDLMKVNLGTIT